MASAATRSFGLTRLRSLPHFEKGLGAQLPEEYKKFWKEWKGTKPTAVHYIPKEGQWMRDVVTGEVQPVQEIPLPLTFPPESDEGIWGGEGIVRGFRKPKPLKRRVPHFWVPVLRRSVVYSAVLDQFMSITVTDRTIDLIHESHGFDHYLLKTPACDLRSTLALSLKRKILKALHEGCPSLADNSQKQNDILKEYGRYLEQYTSEEIEWYGLTYLQAINKLKDKINAENPVVPQKVEFRSKLIEQLRKANITEAGTSDESKVDELSSSHIKDSSSWLAKMNIFGKKQET